ncbi:12605_t:CDS:2, partial [Acaulospora colombiana]
SAATSPVASENSTNSTVQTPISLHSSLATLEQFLHCPITALECPVCGHEFTSFSQLCKNSIIEDFVREYREMRLSMIQLYTLGLQVENKAREGEESKSVAPLVTRVDSQIDALSSQPTNQESDVSENLSKPLSPLYSMKRENSIDLKRSMSNDEADVPAKRIKGENDEMAIRRNKDSISNKPKPVYSLIKDKKLKDMLKDEGLPLSGNRSDWQKRHAYFIHLWNSNADATKPKTKEELIREVKNWERAQQSGAARTANDVKKTLNTEEEIKFYDILLFIQC